VPSHRVHAELSTLVGLFYGSLTDLGVFQVTSAKTVPEPYRGLLVHNQHMTVTMEKFYDGPVDVRVLQAKRDGSQYMRTSLLVRPRDQHILQFGLIRLNFDLLNRDVRQEIERQNTPLGRVLIQHEVMREIELISLWRVQPGPKLQQWFGVGQTTYGRTAIIHCDGEPAVELLEIAAPTEA